MTDPREIMKRIQSVQYNRPTINDVPPLAEDLISDISNPFDEDDKFNLFEESALREFDVDWLLSRERFQKPTADLICDIRKFFEENKVDSEDVEKFMHSYFSKLCIRFRSAISYEVAVEMAGKWMINDYSLVTWTFDVGVLAKVLEKTEIEEIETFSIYGLVTYDDLNIVRMLVKRYGKKRVLKRVEDAMEEYEVDCCYFDRLPLLRKVVGRIKRFK